MSLPRGRSWHGTGTRLPSAQAWRCLLTLGIAVIVTAMPAEAQFVDFLDPTVYAAGVIPEDLVIADVNQDGILDLAVANTNASAPTGAEKVSLFRGLGTGEFAAQTTVTVGGEPEIGRAHV